MVGLAAPQLWCVRCKRGLVLTVKQFCSPLLSVVLVIIYWPVKTLLDQTTTANNMNESASYTRSTLIRCPHVCRTLLCLMKKTKQNKTNKHAFPWIYWNRLWLYEYMLSWEKTSFRCVRTHTERLCNTWTEVPRVSSWGTEKTIDVQQSLRDKT